MSRSKRTTKRATTKRATTKHATAKRATTKRTPYDGLTMEQAAALAWERGA